MSDKKPTKADIEKADWANNTEKRQRAGDKLEKLSRRIQNTPDGEHFITSVTVKIRPEEYNNCMVLVKATTTAGKKIAFHSDDNLIAALVGLENRLANNSLEWREDKPYADRNA